MIKIDKFRPIMKWSATLPVILTTLAWLLIGLFSPTTTFAVEGLNPKSTLLLLGTSKKGGAYYPVGSGICHAVNLQIIQSGVRCVAIVTGGSVYNIHAVKQGILELALTRNDLLEDAYRRKESFANQNFDELRIITPLYDNPLTMIVREDSDINSVDDLVGKRVNIGSKGSGRRTFSEFLFRIKNFKNNDFAEINEYGSSKVIAALCTGKTDVAFQLIAYPSSFYDNLQEQCPLRMLSLSNQTIDEIIKQKPLLFKVELSYIDNQGETRLFQTISTKAVLFSSANTSPELISIVVNQMINFTNTDSGVRMNIPKNSGTLSGSVPRHLGVTHMPTN